MDRLKVMVGCPAYKREWILPTWFDHVRKAFWLADLIPHYAFVLSHDDPGTRDVIRDALEESYGGVRVTFTDQEQKHSQDRLWNEDRYREMTKLRNLLLTMVRAEAPDYFLSLDSDILLDPVALLSLLESVQQFDAVGGKCFMTDTTPDGWGLTSCPSWSNVGTSGQLIRQDADGVFRCDAIMAIKLMSPTAYAIDYEWHWQGEDLGWSKACRENGVKLGFDGRIINKHVMNERALHYIDRRVGW